MQSKKIGIWAGILGTVFGCTAWMALLGAALKDPVLILAPAAVALLCVVAGFWFLNTCPDRLAGIFGLMGLWLMMLNAMIINIYYDRIPETIGGVTTGKSPTGLLEANFFIVVLALVSSGFVIYELLRKK